MRNLRRLYRPAARRSAQPATNETEEQQRYESLLLEIQNGTDSGRIRARFAGMYQSQPEPQYIAPSVPAVYGGSATAWSPGSTGDAPQAESRPNPKRAEYRPFKPRGLRTGGCHANR